MYGHNRCICRNKFMMSIRTQRIQSNSRIVDLHFSFFLLLLLSLLYQFSACSSVLYSISINVICPAARHFLFLYLTSFHPLPPPYHQLLTHHHPHNKRKCPTTTTATTILPAIVTVLPTTAGWMSSPAAAPAATLSTMRLPLLTMATATGVMDIPRRRIDSQDGRRDPGLRVSITGIMAMMDTMGIMMGITSTSLDVIVIIDDVCYSYHSLPVELFTNALHALQNQDPQVQAAPLPPAAPAATITDPTRNPPPQPAPPPPEANPATAAAAKAKTKWPKPSAQPSPPVPSRRSASVKNPVNGPGRRGSGFSLLP